MTNREKYLIVGEGPTDIHFLKKLSESIGNQIGKSIEVVELSPKMDATTQSYPPHGWTGVKRWCKAWKVKTDADISHLSEHFASIARRNNWPALMSISNANGLIIQMDTDIAEKICDLSSSFQNMGFNRRDYCELAVLHWLGETKHSLENKEGYLVLPSYALETWMLAKYPPSNNVFSDLSRPLNYEEIIDCESRLISLGYRSKNKDGVRKLRKKYSFYTQYASDVFNNFDDVKSRCSEARVFESIFID